MAPTNDSLIGARLKRPDGPPKLQGSAPYAADLALPGLLQVRLVLSPYAHARIGAVDPSAALALPGVVAVVTAADLAPLVKSGPESRARCLLADGVARYRGQPVAAVLAETEAAAEDALALVSIEYDELPAVLDADAAFADDAPAVWPDSLPGGGAEAAAHGVESGPGHADAQAGGGPRSPNIAARERMDRGDVDEGLQQADVVIRRTYRTPIVHQGYIEPHATVAALDPLGGLTIW